MLLLPPSDELSGISPMPGLADLMDYSIDSAD